MCGKGMGVGSSVNRCSRECPHMHMGQCIHVCACGGQRSLSDGFLYGSSCYCLRPGLLLNLGLTDSARWAAQGAPGMGGLPAFAFPAWSNRRTQLCLAFYVGAGGGSELEPLYLHRKHFAT